MGASAARIPSLRQRRESGARLISTERYLKPEPRSPRVRSSVCQEQRELSRLQQWDGDGARCRSEPRPLKSQHLCLPAAAASPTSPEKTEQNWKPSGDN